MPAKKVKRSAGATDVKGRPTKNVLAQPEQKTSKSGRRRKLRSLDDIVKMPTDVMHEITRYLHPRDILHLSWASKDFHTFFMRKSSAYIWKRSLGDVQGLPSRPDRLIEPAWITFMFTTWCTGCGTTNTGIETHWNFYARMCKPCSRRNLTQDVYSYEEVKDDEWNICADIPSDALNRVPRKSAYMPNAFLKSDIQDFIDSWKALLKDNADEVTKALFLGGRIIEVRKIAQHAALCSEWVETVAQERKDEQEELRKERLEEVISRLRGLGWGRELDLLAQKDYSILREQKPMRIAKKVTDRVWRNMEADMVACMKKVREEQLAQERRQKLRARWVTFKPILEELAEHPSAKRYKMKYGDIVLMPEVRKIMDVSLDANVVLEPSSFDELRERFGEAVEQWHVRMCDELRTKFFQPDAVGQGSNKAGKTPDPNIDPLELAMSRFRCRCCINYSRPTMWYPDVLFHSCLQVRLGTGGPKAKGGDDYEASGMEILRQWFSSTKLLRRRPSGSLTLDKPTALSCKLIEMCGMDPSTATAKEMDASDVKFVLDNKVMTWIAAVCTTRYPSLRLSVVSVLIKHGADAPPRSTERVLQLADQGPR
ncbi:hypothetical protein FOMPIDRAFT_1053766 [Fomitopsis schrenkii]|uniref:F-box domain-containing protein n=1 Tax=Fomitopsis schrenkii TaxID=2126942 RepID=S8FBD3_FOMSC|nr:hypothetical protein FOMPIDRAFT_1053766 [Fomitopsis schrenkii]